MIFFSNYKNVKPKSNRKIKKKLKLEKLNNTKELEEIEIRLKELEIKIIKERFMEKLEIETEMEGKRLKQTRNKRTKIRKAKRKN